ncbi:TetR/AcrR family transcriptional regulator [Neptunicella marina]|uniref:TetR/AcrR family transcriptional regulator n=1 Tax=Neptunicella marina TaxID=2125989 RepID=A0A8J6M204_9ALTE|nr:TetR/AcrR family transcriptional regulator [Neptunicella marina]MBC3767799.1 TetR/AcrR family transcriptional regulator [Neptunicella marina]
MKMKRAIQQQDKETRKKNILQSALDVFFNKGFKAAKMDEIASNANISKGTLYLYFSSKEQLFVELIQQIASPKVNQVEAMVNNDSTLEDKLNLFKQHAKNMLVDQQLPKLMKIIISDSGAFPELVTTYREMIVDRALKTMSQIIKRAQSNKECRQGDPIELAQLLVAPVIFSAIWRIVFEPSGATKINIDSLLALHINMLKQVLIVKDRVDEDAI